MTGFKGVEMSLPSFCAEMEMKRTYRRAGAEKEVEDRRAKKSLERASRSPELGEPICRILFDFCRQ